MSARIPRCIHCHRANETILDSVVLVSFYYPSYVDGTFYDPDGRLLHACDSHHLVRARWLSPFQVPRLGRSPRKWPDLADQSLHVSFRRFAPGGDEL